MRSFWLGIAVGALLGGGGVYLGIERPWEGGEASAAVAADAGVEPVARAGDGNKRRKKRRKRSGGGNGSEVLGDPIVELSAADRQLVWNGPGVALSPRDVDMGSADEGRSLDQGEIDQAVAASADAIVDCIKDARGNAELAATITMKALVEGTGRVSKVRVRAPRYLIENGVASCIRSEANAMRFAATGAQTVVSVPFNLR